MIRSRHSKIVCKFLEDANATPHENPFSVGFVSPRETKNLPMPRSTS